MEVRLLRKWINAPSVHDDCHEYHGRRVFLVDGSYGEYSHVDVWFADNTSLVSARVPYRALTAGWLPEPSVLRTPPVYPGPERSHPEPR